MFAAPKPRSLPWISKERYRIGSNCGHRRGKVGPMPPRLGSLPVQFLYQIWLAAAAIDQANIRHGGIGSRQDSLRHSPDCAPDCFGFGEILFRDSDCRKLE